MSELIVFRDDVTIKIDAEGVAFTLGARDYKGVQCVSYQAVTGALAPGAHPGGFNGQDAYSDMLVTDDNNNKKGGDAMTSVVRRLTPLE